MTGILLSLNIASWQRENEKMNNKELRKEVLQRFYNKGDKYIARDKNNEVYIYKTLPEKKGSYWSNGYGAVKLFYFSDLFEDVTFEDEQSLDIAKELGIIDWSKVPKDTRVLVSNDGKAWVRRHFAKFNEKGVAKFIVYGLGETSWTVTNRSDDFRVAYEYCKLA